MILRTGSSYRTSDLQFCVYASVRRESNIANRLEDAVATVPFLSGPMQVRPSLKAGW